MSDHREARWAAAIAEMATGIIGYAMLSHAAGFEMATALFFLLWSVKLGQRYERLVLEDAEREEAASDLIRFNEGKVRA